MRRTPAPDLPLAAAPFAEGGIVRRRATALLAGAGAAVAAYLTWVHYSEALALCTGAVGCKQVQASRFASVAGIPVAALGLALYLGVLALALWRLLPGRARPDGALLALFGLALAGALYSLYLTYLELLVIHAICPWCVSSALLITAILALVGVELAASSA